MCDKPVTSSSISTDGGGGFSTIIITITIEKVGKPFSVLS